MTRGREKVHRYFIYLSYNGLRYNGWQTQPRGETVQRTIEAALSTLLREPVAIVGAGRTDAGVHARLMVAHFDWREEIADRAYLVYKLNSLLPKDIAVERIVGVKPEAHARFDATSRTYRYLLTARKDPFLSDLVYRYPAPLDFEAMRAACPILLEYRNFTSFSKLHTDVKTNNCRITRADWTREGDTWVFTITADRFLRNMVRAIVGTMLEIGRGRLDGEGLRRIIEAKDRCRAGMSVPGHALYLVDVTYPADLFLDNPLNEQAVCG